MPVLPSAPLFLTPASVPAVTVTTFFYIIAALMVLSQAFTTARTGKEKTGIAVSAGVRAERRRSQIERSQLGDVQGIL
ncbi:hypothetical protein R1flu_007240 [Riccia fluitans]|uniref:ATP synthase F0 subunit 8 n=1 Tax=Riccia fluitans TaxID=41844 RepID=A0ABD1YY97_9MARC